MKRNIFFLWLFLVTYMVSFAQQDPNFHIYLCFGQSNMEGQGSIESQDYNVNERTFVMAATDCSSNNRSAGKWYAPTPPLLCGKGLCPADYFARKMAEDAPDNIKIGIVIVASAGCDIRLFDKSQYNTGNYDPYNGVPSSYKTNGYANGYAWLLDLAQKAQKDGVIKGILLHQGETNTGQTAWLNYVSSIINDLHADLDLTERVPLLAGELLYSNMGGACSSHNTIINQLPSKVENSYVISSANLPGQDSYHFNSAGYHELGERYATQMMKLITYEPGVEDPIFSYTQPTAKQSWCSDSSYTISWTMEGEATETYNLNWNTGSTETLTVSGATASSEWTNDEGIFSWEASNILTDDGANGKNSRWGAQEVNGYIGEWVTLTLSKVSTVGGVIIDEFEEYGSVTGFEIQYDDNGTWKTIYQGTTIGTNFKTTFSPVSTQEIRLYITSADNVNINYFTLTGVSNLELKSGISQSGSYTWDIPSTLSGSGILTINKPSGKTLITSEAITISSCSGTSISEIGNDRFFIYPNPAKNIIHIESTQEIKLITIFDLTGIALLKTQNAENIDVTNLENGTYIIQFIYNDNNSLFSKFFIRK